MVVRKGGHRASRRDGLGVKLKVQVPWEGVSVFCSYGKRAHRKERCIGEMDEIDYFFFYSASLRAGMSNSFSRGATSAS